MLHETKTQQILEVIEKRGIKYLVHFTHINNLDSILKHGLVPRSKLNELPINSYEFNDQFRYDKAENAICMSISFPNYKMFYRCRNGIGSGENWVVLVFKAELLAEKDCAFCYTNAASNEITSINLEKRKSEFYFRAMFYDIKHNDNIREKLNIPDYYTTDPQAEVLVFDIIQPSEILGIAVSSSHEVTTLSQTYPNIHFQYIPEVFTYRQDYSFWS